ncbi:MAG TPA: tetratricopeptide repeat protein, partial [Treponemataceae bacterium]|nr:tetratricopeptide repeat protein [Treponemataceae bacterium]
NYSHLILEKEPFNPTALTYQGYSAFYLAISQTEPMKAQNFITDSINSLRIARFKTSKKMYSQINYMLGKAYYHKNIICSYTYYADLAIKYLNIALEQGYTANDIYEYLGLSYANLEITSESIAAFTEALQYSDSDLLLMAIAEQYYVNNQKSSAKQYLYRIKKTSTDDSLVLKCSSLLGQIYLDDGQLTEAKEEFSSILIKDPYYADAHYGLGLVYEMQGDIAKARSEWRTTLSLQVNHLGALQKIGQKK